MNEADSEKINMMLLQSGFTKVSSWQDADLVLFNTCSVRKKWEDRVYSTINEISKEKSEKKRIIGITGCMVRKTGINKKYLVWEIERTTAKKIEHLSNKQGIFNHDDKLFPKIESLDFTLRIEEITYLPFILSHIYGEKIGQEDKFSDYLKTRQQRENPKSASIIIQTGCDNYCSFCIVPFTRGKEISRPMNDIIEECKEAVKNGAKEITLLGQNVNSYGKQFIDKKYWNEEKGKWKVESSWESKLNSSLKIWIDLDDTVILSWHEEIFKRHNQKHDENLNFTDIITHNFNGNKNLENSFFEFFNDNQHILELFPEAENTIKKLKNQWHELYVITSRELGEMQNHTHDILEKYFWKGFFKEVIFIKETGEDKKYIAAKLHDIDVVIEDALHHLEDYKAYTQAKIIVHDMPWNRVFQEDESQVFRVKHWKEIETLIERFSKENTLDNKEVFVSPFRKLLEEINTIEWLERIRFTSSNPHDMTQDILDAHFELPRMCNYLHFALQSGSDELLKKMNRKHKYADFKKIVDYVRKKDPLFSISTDIIVGFSGETEEMFDETLHAFDECLFDFSYNARYSVRPWTIASKLYPDDVSDDTKAKRWHKINTKLEECVQKRNQQMIGRVEEVMINGEKDEQFFGRTRNFKEVFFDKQKSPFTQRGMSEGQGDLKIGDIVKVKITEVDRWVLRGEKV